MMDAAIVAGVDGSPTAWSALAWAAEDAERRHLPLRVVHVREPWLAEHPLGASSDEETRTERCDRLLADSAARARELAPGARVSTALVTGARRRAAGIDLVASTVREHPVPALAAASREADLVVVGSRGLGGFASAMLGSVSHGILHRSHCPVVVVGALWGRP